MPASDDRIDVLISRGGLGQEVGLDKPDLIGKVHWERFAPRGSMDFGDRYLNYELSKLSPKSLKKSNARLDYADEFQGRVHVADLIGYQVERIL